MVAFAEDLDDASYDYDLFNMNCVSTVASVLAATGAQYGVTQTGYMVGERTILDVTGSNTFHLFNNGVYGKNYLFYDKSGSDSIYIHDGASVRIFKDTDSTGTNTIYTVGIDPDDIVLVRNGDDLIVLERGLGGTREVLRIADQYKDVEGDGFGADTLQPLEGDGTTPWGGPVDLTEPPPPPPEEPIEPPADPYPAPFTPIGEGLPISYPPGEEPWWEPPHAPFTEAPGAYDPLVLDLDGDGVELTTLDNETTTTFFDIDSDGFAEQMAWVNANDGFLVRDVNENFVIDDGSELFGSTEADGFAILQTLDSNGDLVINSADTAWEELFVWQDTNGNAITDDGELHTLASLDITGIRLNDIAANDNLRNASRCVTTGCYGKRKAA